MRIHFNAAEIQEAICNQALDLLAASSFQADQFIVVLKGDTAVVFVGEEVTEIAEAELAAEQVSTEAQVNEPTTQPKRSRRTRAQIEADEAEEAKKAAALAASQEAEQNNAGNPGDTQTGSAPDAQASENAANSVASSEPETGTGTVIDSHGTDAPEVLTQEPETPDPEPEPEVAKELEQSAEVAPTKPAGVSLFANLRKPTNS